MENVLYYGDNLDILRRSNPHSEGMPQLTTSLSWNTSPTPSGFDQAAFLKESGARNIPDGEKLA